MKTAKITMLLCLVTIFSFANVATTEKEALAWLAERRDAQG